MKARKIVGTCIGVAVLVALLVWAFWPGRETQTERQLTVGSWGGAYQAAQRKAFFEPFQEEHGVRIVEASTPDYGKLYEWQRTGSASIDVVDVETFFVFQAGKKGALARIDQGLLPTASLMKGSLHDFGVASCAYAEVIAWDRKRNPELAELKWTDFWDTDRISGPRAFRDLPATALEAALLADGLPPDRLYPLDVDRAFRKLDELRNKTRVILWSAGSEPIELLKDGTVALSTAWNGRVRDAQKEGIPLEMSFNQAFLDWLWWVIPKDARNKELGMQFIAFTLRVDRQGALAQNIPYGPTNAEAWEKLPEHALRELPNSPENIKRVILRDNDWWADHETEISDRWRQWKLGLEQ
jgi:putative spermidine/putrescine transport system substrate-binding protein